MTRTAGALCALLLATACASTAPTQTAFAQGNSMATSMNSIQPETTITLNGHGSVDREPDMASVNVGVSIEADTAAAAMSEQAEKMNAVFAAVKAAGVADRDMQTSNLSLNPVYDYNRENDSRPRLRGYNASNQITINVRNLDSLGETLDAIVKAGSNQINSVQFSVDESMEAMDEARMSAITDAQRKAELYAQAAGYRVARIVTISEGGGQQPPMPYERLQMADASSTPVARGQVSLTADVNVTFELVK